MDEITVTQPSIEEIREYYKRMQIDLARRLSEIEVFLGFLESSEDLATRVGKLERFVKGQ